MDARATFRFVVVGLFAAALSIAVYRFCFLAGGGALMATGARLLVFVPAVYLGYSRWVLTATLRDEQGSLGQWGAELRMVGRVAASVGMSTLLKLGLEPLIATALAARFGREAATLSPLMADLGYGPAVNYLMLSITSRRQARTEPWAGESEENYDSLGC